MGTQEGLVPMDSPEGERALARQLDRHVQEHGAKREEMMRRLEERGMEPLAKTEARLMKQLKDRLANIAMLRGQAQSRKTNPLGMTFVGGTGGFDVAKHEALLKDYVAKQRKDLEALDREETEVQGVVRLVSAGMEEIARGRKPSGAFLGYLEGQEAEAGRQVRESAQRGIMADDKEFAGVRDRLKALADLRAYAEGLEE